MYLIWSLKWSRSRKSWCAELELWLAYAAHKTLSQCPVDLEDFSTSRRWYCSTVLLLASRHDKYNHILFPNAVDRLTTDCDNAAPCQTPFLDALWDAALDLMPCTHFASAWA